MRSCSVVFEVDSAVTVLARGGVLMACSEEDALGGEGRGGGERRKEFLRMPRGRSDSCGGERGEVGNHLLVAGMVKRYAWLERLGSCLLLVRRQSTKSRRSRKVL